MCPDLLSQGITTNKVLDNAITLGKIQDIQDKMVIGRSAGTNGDPQQVTLTDSFYCDVTNARLWVNNYDCFKTRVEFFDDCFGAVTDGTSSSNFLTANTSGSGAAVSNVTVAETGVLGVRSLDTGTTSTGRSALFSGRNNTGAALTLGQGVTKIKTKVKFPTLSTSGERYKFVFGFTGDCSTATINDGVYFEYSEADNANWKMCTANDGTRTETPSNVTVAQNTWVRLEVAVSSTASVCSFLLNGSTLSSITTNIPSGTGDPVSPIVAMFKTNGSTSRAAQIDYVGFSLELTSARST